MRIEEGQVVEVCSDRSKGWTHGFNKGSKITLVKRLPDDGGPFAGEWDAVSSSGYEGLIAEKDFRSVVEGPVRTVTRQEIIPGTYDGVTIHDPGSKYVRVVVNEAMDHEALTRAAAVLTALAEALRDGE